MTTPDPRGFPHKSIEATICETLADGRAKQPDHWSFDSEAERRQKKANAAARRAAQGKKIGVNVKTVADAMALLEALQNAVK